MFSISWVAWRAVVTGPESKEAAWSPHLPRRRGGSTGRDLEHGPAPPRRRSYVAPPPRSAPLTERPAPPELCVAFARRIPEPSRVGVSFRRPRARSTSFRQDPTRVPHGFRPAWVSTRGMGKVRSLRARVHQAAVRPAGAVARLPAPPAQEAAPPQASAGGVGGKVQWFAGGPGRVGSVRACECVRGVCARGEGPGPSGARLAGWGWGAAWAASRVLGGLGPRGVRPAAGRPDPSLLPTAGPCQGALCRLAAFMQGGAASRGDMGSAPVVTAAEGLTLTAS